MPFIFTTKDGRTYAYESEVGNGPARVLLTEVAQPEQETSLEESSDE